MVQAIIQISEESNHILNIVKAKYRLKDKSEAINMMAQQYQEQILEPELRPSYIETAQKISREKPIPIGTVAALRARHT